MEPQLATAPVAPAVAELAEALRGAPEPTHGGPLALLRFLRAHRMLTLSYARLITRFTLLKLRFGSRLQTEGLCFICPGVHLEIGPHATLRV